MKAEPLALLLALAFVVGVLAAGCVPAQRGGGGGGRLSDPMLAGAVRDSVCAGGGWLPVLEPRLADGRRLVVAAATLVPLRTGLALAGSPTFVWHSATQVVDTTGHQTAKPGLYPDPTTTSAGAVLRPDGTFELIPFPPGVHFITRQLALPDGRGGMHVAMGIPSFPMGMDFPRTVAVWYAHFDGRKWSKPEEIYAGNIEIFDQGAAVLLESDGVLQLALRGWENTPHGTRYGVVYARRINGKWERQWLLTEERVQYVAAVALAPRELILLFTGGLVFPDDRRSNPFGFVRSTDNGSTWSKPEIVRDLEDDDRHHLRAVRDRSGMTHVVWVTDFFAQAMLHHLVTNDLQNWREMPPLSLNGGLLSYSLLLNRRDSLLVLRQLLPAGRLALSAWNGERWSESNLPVSHSYAIPAFEESNDTLFVAAAVAETLQVTPKDSMLGPWMRIARRVRCR
jgi:hypothetical protein